MRLDFVVEPRVEGVSIGQARQRIVVCKKMNMLLGLLPITQIADGDSMVRLPGEVDRAKDEFSRNKFTVGVAQFSLDALPWLRGQFVPESLLGQADRQ